MKTTLIRGVPKSLQQDGWWMGDIQPHRPARHTKRRFLLTAAGLAGLTILAALGGERGFPAAAPSHSLADRCSDAKNI